jgi:hydrogenase maturation protease
MNLNAEPIIGKARTLVLGVGNILLQDEGVGVRVVEHLQQHYSFADSVELLDGGTLGLDLINYLEELDNLLVLDAVNHGQSPGSFIRLVDDEIPALLQQKMSPHQIGLSDILSVARLRDMLPKQVVLLGVQPAAIQTGLELSPTVQACVGTLVEQVLQQLEAWGIGFQQQ